MPIYIELANLIFSKELISLKYEGGIDQFRKDYDLANSTLNQEDDELFSLSQMNLNEFDIEKLTAKGLSFENNSSTDFIAISRYGGAEWETDWAICNTIFVWHVNCDQQQIDRANVIANMDMNTIMEKIDQGIDVFETIKTI